MPYKVISSDAGSQIEVASWQQELDTQIRDDSDYKSLFWEIPGTNQWVPMDHPYRNYYGQTVQGGEIPMSIGNLLKISLVISQRL